MQEVPQCRRFHRLLQFVTKLGKTGIQHVDGQNGSFQESTDVQVIKTFAPGHGGFNSSIVKHTMRDESIKCTDRVTIFDLVMDLLIPNKMVIVVETLPHLLADVILYRTGIFPCPVNVITY